MKLLRILGILYFIKLFKDLKKSPIEKRKRTSTKKYALVMPYGKYKNRLLCDVPSGHVQKLLRDGALDKPRYKWLKNGFKKNGKI